MEVKEMFGQVFEAGIGGPDLSIALAAAQCLGRMREDELMREVDSLKDELKSLRMATNPSPSPCDR